MNLLEYLPFDVQSVLKDPLLPAIIITVLFVYVGLKYGIEKKRGAGT